MNKLIALFLVLTQTAFAGLPPTSLKGSQDTSAVTTFKTIRPDDTVYHSGVTSTITRNGRPFKNYIPYADFENNATTGWSLGTVGTLTNGLPTGTPTFGSGASVNLSIATSSSSPLAGTYSLTEVSSAATTSGDMLASAAISLDTADQARVLQVKFSYLAGSNANWSGTNSNSYAWAVYDVTNSVWLSTAGNFCMVQSSGAGVCTGTFQTGSSTASMRFVIYNANATTGASTLKLDDFYVGPQITAMGPAMTDWKSYTPTFGAGWGSVVTSNMFYRQFGDSVQIYGSFVTATVTSGVGKISLPSGLSVSASAPAKFTVGNMNAAISTTNGVQNQVLLAWLTDGIYPSNFADGTHTNDLLAISVNQAFGSAQTVTVPTVTIPIAGWSSNSAQSSDTDTRVVDFSGTKGSTQSVTANVTDITFTSVQDSHAAWGGSSYTVPVSGDYDVAATLADNSTNNNDFSVYINGVQKRQLGTGNANYGGGSALLPALKAGDTISIRSNVTSTLFGGGNISISRKSGPAIVSATESVNASYSMSSTGAPGSGVQFNFDNKIFDSHSAVTTGASWKFTAPVSGKYSVSLAATTGNSTAGAVNLYKNGVINVSIGITAGANGNPGGTVIVPLNTGDFIDLRPNSATSISGGTLGSGTFVSAISITRVGN